MNQLNMKSGQRDSGSHCSSGSEKTFFSVFIFLELQMKNIYKYFIAVFTALTLVTIVGCQSTSTQEGTGEYIDDTVITTKVKAAIFNDPLLKVAEINVETYKGIVQLSGFVRTNAAADRAVDVASKVGGVKSVKNDLRLK
jgi:hyperosmotically inducible protein